MKKILFILSTATVFMLCAQDTAMVQPQPLYKKMPQYPENAKKLRIEAQIALSALIGKDGNVEGTELLSAIVTIPGKTVTLTTVADLNMIPASHRNTAAKLLELTHQTARQWKFTPAMASGKPEESVIVIPFTFKLTPKTQGKDIPQKK